MEEYFVTTSDTVGFWRTGKACLPALLTRNSAGASTQTDRQIDTGPIRRSSRAVAVA